MSVTPLKTPASKGGEFELVPAGVYLARCYRMIDLGTQTETSAKFGTKSTRKIMLGWELLQDDDGEAITMTDGRPFVISNNYTWSLDKKANLRKALDSWRGVPFTDAEAQGFEITKLLDKFCKIQVVHNVSGDNTYANVGTLISTKKTATPVNEAYSFSIDDPDLQLFNTFPEWLQTKISEAAEWQVATDDGSVSADGKVAAEVVEDPIVLSELPF